MARSGCRTGAEGAGDADCVGKKIHCKKICGKENIYRGVGALHRSGGLGAGRTLGAPCAGYETDGTGHDCVLRGEACGTADGFIVGDGAEIICNGKLNDSQRLERAGLDIFWGEPLDEVFSGLPKVERGGCLNTRRLRE